MASLDALAGYKTYLALGAWMIFELLNAKHVLGIDADTAMMIRTVLLGAAGVSQRAATQKAQDAATPDPVAPAPSKN
jgi:hypothetical protein